MSGPTPPRYDTHPNPTARLTRTNRELVDLPQSVDILPAEFLLDTGARMMDEGFVYVDNAQVRNSSAEPDANTTLIRGFTNATSYTDGIDTGTYRRDLFGYERMEVIKGPASAVQGRDTDSGYINFGLKKPIVGANFNRIGVSYSFGANDKNKTGKRFTFDKNVAISGEKGLYGRFAAVWGNHDHYFDFAEFKTAALSPSFRWVINEKTDIAIVGEFLDVEAPNRSPGHGFAWIPAEYRKEIPIIGASTDPITALNLPTNFNIGGPQPGADDTVASVLAIATHKFSEAIQHRQAVTVLNSTQDGEWWDAECNFPTPHTSISAAFKADPAIKYDPNGVYIWGKIMLYRNVGTKTAPRLAVGEPLTVAWPGATPKPSWVWWTPEPGTLVTQWRTTPQLTGWNQDGLLDLVMLDQEGYLAFFERRKQADGQLELLPPQQVFWGEGISEYDGGGRPRNEVSGLLRMNGRDAGGNGRRTFTFHDWDRDGELDLLVNSDTNINVLRGLGRDAEGRWRSATTVRLARPDLPPIRRFPRWPIGVTARSW